jgi:hypothetical protein
MRCAWLVLGLFVLAGTMGGCGGGVTPDQLPPEQKAPDYGQKSADQMKSEYGVPGANGAMKK